MSCLLFDVGRDSTVGRGSTVIESSSFQSDAYIILIPTIFYVCLICLDFIYYILDCNYAIIYIYNILYYCVHLQYILLYYTII